MEGLETLGEPRAREEAKTWEALLGGVQSTFVGLILEHSTCGTNVRESAWGFSACYLVPVFTAISQEGSLAARWE